MARAGNNHKGGRPKGTKSPVTLKVEKAKQALIDAYILHIKPINEALINKAKQGDIQAIKELHDRVYGKAPQAITGPDGKQLTLIISGESAQRFNVQPTRDTKNSSN